MHANKIYVLEKGKILRPAGVKSYRKLKDCIMRCGSARAEGREPTLNFISYFIHSSYTIHALSILYPYFIHAFEAKDV
jgi:hypothetical protein